LSKNTPDVVLVEKEDSFGRHTSSRNSEVVHSGIYYPQNTLKATLCLTGNRLMLEEARENGIPHNVCGKIIVATCDEEIPALQKLKNNGERNKVTGLEIIDKKHCFELEPDITAVQGIWVPTCAIIDTHSYMKFQVAEAEAKDAFIIYGMEVTEIEKTDEGYIVSFANGEQFLTKILINSGGLFCESISRMAGIDTAEHNLRIHWCRGEYFKTNRYKNISHLVYPLPDTQGIFLGIHLTINLNREVRFGPNAIYTDNINYKLDETNLNEFSTSINRYMSIEKKELHPDDIGIRAKLQGQDEGFRDFYIQEESEKGLPGFVNLMGIESPGFTAAPAIARLVNRIVQRIST
ncbi:MAG: NAD(P)/FAD-dependent oxidoreductase, partial [Candidatus Cloacimonetes bacterium]|nr:NAD(P)/FAD-dependent oxidoreductase [Candidatus Cloacimonadota bacterium]